jgi:hypothetical protein
MFAIEGALVLPAEVRDEEELAYLSLAAEGSPM